MRYNGEYNLNLIVFGIVVVVILIGAFIASQQKSKKLSLYDARLSGADVPGHVEQQNKSYLYSVEKKIKQAGIKMLSPDWRLLRGLWNTSGRSGSVRWRASL